MSRNRRLCPRALRRTIALSKSLGGGPWQVNQRALSDAVKRLWAAFLSRPGVPVDAETRFYDIFQVGDEKADADEGADLILTGVKTATSSLQWEYDATGKPPPRVGAFSIVANGSAEPVCVVETTWLEVLPFSQIDADFARDYGEWDGTLATWRKECWAYYSAQCKALNRIPSRDMPLLCERFRVVFPEPR